MTAARQLALSLTGVDVHAGAVEHMRHEAQLRSLGEGPSAVSFRHLPDDVTRCELPAEKRDRSLARHAQDEDKRRLRDAADIVARDLIARDGATNSPRVVAELERRGLGHLLMGLDRRAMGTVLLPTRGYAATGEYRNEGSKGRPAKMWRRS